MAEPRQSDRQVAEGLVILGRVGAPHGVRGWVRLTSYTEPREALLDYRECYLRRGDTWQPARLVEGRTQGRSLVGHFDGVDDRDAAIAWRGAELAVPREALPEPEEGHYYWADLEGLKVRHLDGTELGTVSHLLPTGAHDVLVVAGEKERLIPFVMDRFIRQVDLDAGVIDVDWEWD